MACSPGQMRATIASTSIARSSHVSETSGVRRLARPAVRRWNGYRRRCSARYARGVSEEHDVIVVGAGVAGLACARTLARGWPSSPRARALRRDRRTGQDGCRRRVPARPRLPGASRLAYPEARRALDYDRLALGMFERGAIIRSDGRFRRVADPRHSPVRSLRALAGGVVGVRDGAAVAAAPARLGRRDDVGRGPSRRRRLARHRRALLRAVPARRLSRGTARDVEPVPRLRAARRSPTGRRRCRAAGMGAIAAQLAEGLDVRNGAAVATVGPRCRLARVRRAAPRRGRRRRDRRNRRRAGARLERRHLRLLRRTGGADPGAVARRSTAKAARSTTSACRARSRRATPPPGARSSR